MKRLEILVMTGALAGKRFAVPAAGLRLGRSSQNDISIVDEELSRLHCQFDPVGETGVTVVDLASANGTFVNGKSIDSDTVTLQAGDVITVGQNELHIVGDEAQEAAPPKPEPPKAEPPHEDAPKATAKPAESVDLGFSGKNPTPDADFSPSADASETATNTKHRRQMFIVLLGLVAIALVALLFLPSTDGARPEETAQTSAKAAPVAAVATSTKVLEMHYEKVDADTESIFRYAMDLSPSGQLTVTMDDVPRDNRHVVKSVALNERALAAIAEILLDAELAKVDRDYQGPEGDGASHQSRALDVVYDTRVKHVSIINAEEPDAFRNVRTRLEAFAQNELGIWAIQYSREKLIELANAAAEGGRVKFEDRDAEYGNLAGAIKSYTEALFYLETVTPKPPEAESWRDAKDRATEELDRRVRDQRFKADRAVSVGEFDNALTELRILCEMVPDRRDDRNREAREKMLDVEKRRRQQEVKK